VFHDDRRKSHLHSFGTQVALRGAQTVPAHRLERS